MYRILVVDDESFITDSLAFMLENLQEPELEVKKAYSVLEAIELLNCTAFHIVVTDIEMPGKLGIELLKEINEKWPLCQVVFLTGHDDFQYAKQAMRYNVVRYVLKNEGDDILLEAIEECIRRIKKEQLSTDYMRGASAAYDYSEKKWRHELMWRRMGLQQVSDNLASQWEEAKLCLDPSDDVMLMAGHTSDQISEDTFDVLHTIVTAKIGYAVSSEVILTGEKLYIWVMQPTERSNRTHALATIKGLIETIRETIKISTSVRITFVLAEEEIPWSDVQGQLVQFEDIARNHLEMHEGLALAGLGFFEQQNEAGTGAAFVGHVLRYIQENLSSDLSLTTLSELVYLNPSYLSRRFKEITGMNLKDAILKFRMEESCRLLGSTANRIKNIALQVGFESAAHFSRIFKREMGVTPQEYRYNIML